MNVFCSCQRLSAKPAHTKLKKNVVIKDGDEESIGR